MMKKVEVFADEIESENMSVKIPGSNLLLRLNLERLNQGWINLHRELKIQKAFLLLIRNWATCRAISCKSLYDNKTVSILLPFDNIQQSNNTRPREKPCIPLSLNSRGPEIALLMSECTFPNPGSHWWTLFKICNKSWGKFPLFHLLRRKQRMH